MEPLSRLSTILDSSKHPVLLLLGFVIFFSVVAIYRKGGPLLSHIGSTKTVVDLVHNFQLSDVPRKLHEVAARYMPHAPNIPHTPHVPHVPHAPLLLPVPLSPSPCPLVSQCPSACKWGCKTVHKVTRTQRGLDEVESSISTTCSAEPSPGPAAFPSLTALPSHPPSPS